VALPAEQQPVTLEREVFPTCKSDAAAAPHWSRSSLEACATKVLANHLLHALAALQPRFMCSWPTDVAWLSEHASSMRSLLHAGMGLHFQSGIIRCATVMLG
jgi:hypothetical protein